MEIAVPSDNGKNISEHFGRCFCFIIYQTKGRKIIGREVKDNNCCPHHSGVCPKMVKNKTKKFTKKVRESTMEGIRDCDLLIGKYVNPVLKETLKKYNIDFMVVDEKEADEAVEKYLLGALIERPVFPRCEPQQCQLTCLEQLDEKVPDKKVKA